MFLCFYSIDLDDQASWGTNDGSIYNIGDDPSGSRSDRPRRFIRKKEKGDAVKRPGNHYHSRVIDDMPVGQGSPSLSHVTPSFVEANVTYGSKARLSQAHISLIDVNSPSLCSTITGTQEQRVSSALIKRSLRSASAKEPSERKQETIELECMSQKQDNYAPQDNQETVIRIESDSTHFVQAQENQTSPNEEPAKKPGAKVFRRTFEEEYKPLVSLEDLNFIHRLPVSSAFTYSFYELPSQHRVHNDSIKQAVGRIGRRKKKGTAQFRSKSAP